MSAHLRAAVAARLERGGGGAALSLAWEALAEQRWRPGAPRSARPRIVAVAGSRLGGSQATPTALALALALGARGAEVAVVTRAMGAGITRPTDVAPDDDPRAVGDEGLWLARASSARVVVARRLEEGVTAASSRAELVIVDGRVAAHERLLCHDPDGPLRCPPAGDLRAPLHVLRAWATAVRVSSAATLRVELPALPGPALLATAIARPHRVREALGGLPIVEHLAYPDHGGPRFRAAVARAVARLGVDWVVCTEKCATWLPARVAGARVVPVVARALVDEALVDSL
ncbi:MAG: tetraacyldisaccharide 4'-kinase [Polyangiaceae bacterium]|nr:tetraacyldisaccharide 4'-kinase [Polyangiaceae bacterium]